MRFNSGLYGGRKNKPSPCRASVMSWVRIACAQRFKQLARATATLTGQLPQRVLTGRIPLRWPPRARRLEQADHTALAPPARPVLDAVQMHAEARRDDRERLAASQLLQSLRTLPHARMRMMNDHLVQGPGLRFIQLQAGHVVLVVAS